ncbi:MAG: hypothetical protein PVG71_02110 [Anaerolineae bacterium]
MRYSTRELVYVAIFGSVWGALELSLGSVLHVLNIPQTGTIMAAVGIVVLLTGHTFVPRRGAVLMMGLTAAFVKMFSLGGIAINPMLAIVMEAALVEAGLQLGRSGRRTFLLAAVMGSSWNFIHPFVTQGLLAGCGMTRVYRWLVHGGAQLLGLPEAYGWLILGLLLGLKGVAGLLAGHTGWEVSRAVHRRRGLASKVAAGLSE